MKRLSLTIVLAWVAMMMTAALAEADEVAGAPIQFLRNL